MKIAKNGQFENEVVATGRSEACCVGKKAAAVFMLLGVCGRSMRAYRDPELEFQ